MASLQIHLFGSPRLELDNTPLSLGRRNTLALLAYLAVTGRPHRRESLLTLLFPDHQPTMARRYLRRDLSHLNQKLGGAWIDADRAEVGFDQETDSWVDVVRFRDLLGTAQRHSHQDGSLCPNCLASLAEAADLHTADFMSGFSLPEAPDFNDWLFFERENLRQALAGALQTLSAYHSGRGEYEAAIPYARRWLALDPLHEPAQRQLMRLYAWSGQPVAALRQYEECARLLESELGVSPEEETTALYAAIKSRRLEPPPVALKEPVDDDTVEPPPDTAVTELLPPPPTLSPPVTHNLPPQATPFIGREKELAELQALLAEPQTRLITIVGPGGMGKTRLALACAERLVGAQRAAPLQAGSSLPPPSFEHGLFFVDLAPLDEVEQMVPTLAQVLNFPLQGGESEKRTPRQQILDYLRRKRMLLLLDNFEHLLDGADLVADILDSAPEVEILVTSRERLHLHGEQLFAIQGLEFPDWETPEDAAQYTAVKLFLQSAGRIRRNFRLQGDDLTYLSRICLLVEGMPLAIELAAGWVDLLSLQEISSEIARGLDMLETEDRNVPRRQRSLRAVFDHSWERLSQEERDALARFSLFRGGCTRDAAGMVSGASLHTLANLANKSLIRFRRSDSHYQVHDLLRQYSAEKLALNPEAEATARDGHCAYYCQALARWEDDLRGARQLAALAEMAADIDNAWAAWRWAVDQVKTKRLAQAVDGLCLFYEMRSRFQEGEQACRLALEKLAELKKEDADGLRLQARVLAWQGLFVRWRRGTKQAHQLWGQSLALLEKPELASLDTRLERAFILMLRGEHSWLDATIAVEVAIETAEESVALYRELGDRWGMARALSAMGDLILHKVNPGQAKPFLEESLAIRQALGDQWGVADSLSGLSWVFGTQGQPAEGERLKRKSLAIYREIGDQRHISWGLAGIGNTLVWQGRFAEAQPLVEEYLAISDDLGADTWIAWANSLAGFPDLYLGRYAEAKAQAQRGLALSREIGLEWGIGLSAFILGSVALAEEMYDEARHWFQEFLAVYPPDEDFTSGGQALACLGYVARGLGQPAQAKGYLYEALAGASERHTYLPLIHALPGIALMLADEGEKERAVELYALAKTQGMVANSKWFEDIAGRHIAAVASTLPPGVAAEAEARGKARDFWETAAELAEELGQRGWG